MKRVHLGLYVRLAAVLLSLELTGISVFLVRYLQVIGAPHKRLASLGSRVETISSEVAQYAFEVVKAINAEVGPGLPGSP